MLNNNGLFVMGLGDQEKRVVKDDTGNMRMIHALESVSFLKLEPQNFVLFECSDENRIISVS